MAVVVVWVGGRGSEAVDADGRAGFAGRVVVCVIGAAGVVVADIKGPVCFERGDGVGRVEIEIGAVRDEFGKCSWGGWVWWSIELVCD